MPNSINTNIAAYYAQSNISKASNSASSSVARLSSGNRIVQAKDDVAALAAGTSLQTATTTLKMALVNSAQGSSLLQVADGALSQVLDILQRQKAISIQAGAGSMGNAERGFLNQEFQNLAEEIDRLTANTNFNGVTLLDGSVFEKNEVAARDNVATKATGSINFSANLATGGKTVIINGVTFTSTIAASAAANTFLVSTTDTQTTIDNLANYLNGSTATAVSMAKYSRVGNSLVIEAKNGGELGRTFSFDMGTSAVTTGTGILMAGTRYTLQGGDDAGISFGRTIGRGVIGDSILAAQSQIKGNNTIAMPATTAANLVTTLNNKTITFNASGLFSFVFVTTASGTNDFEIQIGSTLEESLDNAVRTLNNFKNTANGTDIRDFAFNQVNISREGRNIVIERKDVGNVNSDNNAVFTVATSVTGATPTAATNFNNGATSGITTSGVANKDWLGSIQGFSATYTGVSNRADVEITVGDHTYMAQGVTTNPTAATTVRFTSVNGGYFDISMAANQGSTVTNQDQAATFAARLDAAFQGIQFYQNRNISSYVGAGDILTNGSVTGSLTGTSFDIQLGDFTDVSISDIRVTAPLTGNANGIIEFDINGETFRSSGTITDRMGAQGLYRFQSLTNADHFLEMRTGTTVSYFRNSDEAQNLEDALKNAFQFGEGGASLAFQVGTTTSDTLSVAISSVKTSKIYGGESIDVLTQVNAAKASDVLDGAIRAVTSARAEVGALQSRFSYASNNIESSLQNQDAARGVLLDTDIARESTAYATAQVQLQAGIAVLAQANLLPQNLLKLIG